MQSKNKVYLLHHCRKDDEYMENCKFIGVYASEEDAMAAIERLKNQPGFCCYPQGFHFEACEINKDRWTEGFITVDTIFVRNLILEAEQPYICVHATNLNNETYEIFSTNDDPSIEKWEFQTGDIVRCQQFEFEPNQIGLLAVQKVNELAN